MKDLFTALRAAWNAGLHKFHTVRYMQRRRARITTEF